MEFKLKLEFNDTIGRQIRNMIGAQSYIVKYFEGSNAGTTTFIMRDVERKKIQILIAHQKEGVDGTKNVQLGTRGFGTHIFVL